MSSSLEKTIFKNGSTTYYFSSKFFPRGVRDDVFKLYSFVRVVDDMVDTVPAEIERFERMCHRWQTVKKQLAMGQTPGPIDDSLDERVLSNMVFIVHRYDCDPMWVDAFLASMRMDVQKRTYQKLDDTLAYIYGSAEVIGLFMARILRLPIAPYHAAQMQGRAMQFINFLRDIEEDNQLGRCYFPKRTLQKFGLKDLRKSTALEHQAAFKAFIHEQLDLYDQWQTEANKGMHYIPRRLRVPLKTAVDMYNWTAREIRKNPFVIYEKKVKPRKRRVILRATKLTVSPK